MEHSLCHTKFKRKLVPSSQSNLGSGWKKVSLDRGCLTTPTVDMLVGQDVPQLREWLTEEVTQKPDTTEESGIDMALVTTRAQEQKQNEEQQLSLTQQADEEVVLSNPEVRNKEEEEVGDELPFNFGNDFFIRKKPRSKTGEEKEQEPSLLPDRVSPGELRALQQTDPYLEKARQQADQSEDPYLWEKGLLVRKPYLTRRKDLILVPRESRTEILKMAHCSPMAGHFGRARTLAIIRQNMDWPNLTMDVRNVCLSCPICQHAKPMIIQHAPLHSLPVMSVPFQRIAMDIFGPLREHREGINMY